MIRKGIKQLIAEAEKKSRGISVEEARKRQGDPGTVFAEGRTFILYCQADWRGVLAGGGLARAGAAAA